VSDIPKWCRNLCNNSKKRAKNKGIEFDLTPEWIYDRYERFDRRCEVTGMYYNTEKQSKYDKNPLMPSVDRIESTWGYTTDNCRLVCVCVNYAMNEWGEWTVHQMAKGISELGLEDVDCDKKKMIREIRKLEEEKRALEETISESKFDRVSRFPSGDETYDMRKKDEAELFYDLIKPKLDEMLRWSYDFKHTIFHWIVTGIRFSDNKDDIFSAFYNGDYQKFCEEISKRWAV